MCPDVETPISQSFHCVSFHAACAKLTLNEHKGKCKNQEGVIGPSKVVGDFTGLPTSRGSCVPLQPMAVSRRHVSPHRR